jgi:hypothetical protein
VASGGGFIAVAEAVVDAATGNGAEAEVGIKGAGNGAAYATAGGGLGGNTLGGTVIGIGGGYVLVGDVGEAALGIVGPVGKFRGAGPGFQVWLVARIIGDGGDGAICLAMGKHVADEVVGVGLVGGIWLCAAGAPAMGIVLEGEGGSFGINVGGLAA